MWWKAAIRWASGSMMERSRAPEAIVLHLYRMCLDQTSAAQENSM